MNPEPTFEEAMGRLEAVVAGLERGDLTLDKAMEAYQEGVTLVQTCRDRLSQAELVVRRLTEDAQGNPVVMEIEA
jgi:exodeoxyribonuclease VII small subunit